MNYPLSIKNIYLVFREMKVLRDLYISEINQFERYTNIKSYLIDDEVSMLFRSFQKPYPS